MKSLNFNKTRIAACISATLAMGLTGQLHAEDNDTAKDVEVIEIKGIRGSLIRSMDLKRSESGVVEAISAEELGKFPDSNLAEALQRITGVTVSRQNGEGSQITVRGFGPEFNLLTLNGRQMPGTGNTRSYDLANLSAEGVNTLEFFKTSRADKPTGGLGATVNIITTKPLSKPGTQLSVSAKGINDTSVVEGDSVTPELAAVFSTSNDDQTLGFAFSGSYSKRDFQKQNANIQGWQLQKNEQLPDLPADKVTDNRPIDAATGEHTGYVFFPRDTNYGIEDVEWERANAQVTLQFAPIDDMVFTLDYTATRSLNGSNSIGWGMWNEYGGNINAYEVDENGTVVWADISGNDGSFTANRATTEVEADSIGVNFNWQLTDTLNLELDYHDSSNAIDNGADNGLEGTGSLVFGSNELNTKVYDYREGEIPHAMIYWNEGGTTLPASMMDSHFSQFIHSPGESEIQQLQLHTTWENEDVDSFLVNVKVGAAHTDQTIGGSNAWSGLIGGFLFNPSYVQAFPDSMFELNSTEDLLDQFEGGGSDLSPDYYYTFDFDEAVARSEAFLDKDLLGSDYFSTNPYREGGTYGEGYVNEVTSSAYIQAQFEFEVLDMPMQLNTGVRYEETEVTSSVLQDIPTAVWWKGGSEFLTQYADQALYEQVGAHDFVLPMLDFKIDLTDDVVARFSYGKSITRAPLGNLAATLNLSGSPKIGSRTGGNGNTNLQPYEATNLDFSLEYYYEEGSYASIGLFQKKVKNFISTKIEQEEFEGIRDIYQGPRWNQAVSDLEAAGEQTTTDNIYTQMIANGAEVDEQGFIKPTSEDPTMVWDINKPFNATDTKTVEGIEVALQHLFGESGFGFGVNATMVEGDVNYDVNPEDIFAPQSPLVGIGDSANFQVFYENDSLSVKVVYAWRDSYLLGVGQGQGSSDAPPQFAKEFGQWDMSVNYDVSENITVFFDGINLNNETEEIYGRYERQFLSASQYGTRYVFGARYSF